jgi:outer membrane protein TolC
MLLPVRGTAQQAGNLQQPASIPASHGLSEDAGTSSSLRELVQEAEHKNPQIAASFHAWQAARNVPKQVSALPETQVSVQQFSVGSPRPFAGYSNSDFAYIGVGASQDIPYPAKRRLRASVAEHEADSMEAQTAERWWGISRWFISTWPTFSKPSECCREVTRY